MRLINVDSSRLSLRKFVESITGPCEAVSNGRRVIIWPAESLEGLADVVSEKRARNELKRSLADAAKGDFVEFHPRHKSNKRSSLSQNKSRK